MRKTIVIVLALGVSACSFLEQIDFSGTSLDPNKIYLSRTTVVSVAPRETHRYACVDRPLLCTRRGLTFECRCA